MTDGFHFMTDEIHFMTEPTGESRPDYQRPPLAE
jgi:hypothetical protein